MYILFCLNLSDLQIEDSTIGQDFHLLCLSQKAKKKSSLLELAKFSVASLEPESIDILHLCLFFKKI